MSDPRSIELGLARACINDARVRRLRGYPRIAATLLTWAGNARRRAMAVKAEQGELFS